MQRTDHSAQVQEMNDRSVGKSGYMGCPRPVAVTGRMHLWPPTP